jgi:hypothetical protein
MCAPRKCIFFMWLTILGCCWMFEHCHRHGFRDWLIVPFAPTIRSSSVAWLFVCAEGLARNPQLLWLARSGSSIH